MSTSQEWLRPYDQIHNMLEQFMDEHAAYGPEEAIAAVQDALAWVLDEDQHNTLVTQYLRESS